MVNQLHCQEKRHRLVKQFFVLIRTHRFEGENIYGLEILSSINKAYINMKQD